MVSCYPRSRGDDHADALREKLAEFQIACDIEPIDTADGEHMRASETYPPSCCGCGRRIASLCCSSRPMQRSVEPPLLPSSLDCDVALHKWNRWEMSARTLYLGRTAAAEALLRNWHHIASAYPAVWEGYLLDQAWSLTSSQMALDTVWLPRSYHAPAEDVGTPRHTTVVHNLPADNGDLGPDAEFGVAMRAAAARQPQRRPRRHDRDPVPGGLERRDHRDHARYRGQRCARDGRQHRGRDRRVRRRLRRLRPARARALPLAGRYPRGEIGGEDAPTTASSRSRRGRRCRPICSAPSANPATPAASS